MFRLRLALLVVVALLLAGCSDVSADEAGDSSSPAKVERREAAPKPEERADRPSARPSARPQAEAPARSNARAMFRRLPVRETSTSKYSRDAFKHWVDEDSDGCDTRREVLRRENRGTGSGGRCGAERGEWVSAYDGVVTHDPSSFDIDHLIPLAEAWRSGADQWPDAKREAFANDLHPFSLIAVTASSNRSKSDKDPSEWMPPNPKFHCQYVARWIAVKFRWRLAVDRAERRALAETLNSCDARSLRLSLRVQRLKPAN